MVFVVAFKKAGWFSKAVDMRLGGSINRLVHVAKKVDNENASHTLRGSYMFRNAK